MAHDGLDGSAAVAGGLEIDELLHQLDDDRRAAFVLTQLTGLRYDEAADILGVPIGTIRSRVARARDQLLQALGDAEATQEPEQRRRRPLP
jgi:RNA polymerase sigma-70 factor (ECF subfamily)